MGGPAASALTSSPEEISRENAMEPVSEALSEALSEEPLHEDRNTMTENSKALKAI
jgi:hypothetical protein